MSFKMLFSRILTSGDCVIKCFNFYYKLYNIIQIYSTDFKFRYVISLVLQFVINN